MQKKLNAFTDLTCLAQPGVYNAIKPFWTMTWFLQVLLAELALITCLFVIIINAEWKSLTAFKNKKKNSVKSLTTLRHSCGSVNSLIPPLFLCPFVVLFSYSTEPCLSLYCAVWELLHCFTLPEIHNNNTKGLIMFSLTEYIFNILFSDTQYVLYPSH